MIENEIYRFLVSTMCPSMTGAVGTRLYIGQIPQTVTYPCAIMFLISRQDGNIYDIPADRIQFSCYADSYSISKGLAEIILSLLKRLNGDIFSGSTLTASTYTVFKTMFQNLTYLYDDSVYKHVSILDMTVQYKI